MSDLIKICCICLRKCELAQKLYESDANYVKFEEKLQCFLPNEVWKEDYLICAECIEKLNDAYEFLQICLKSEEYRKSGSQIILESQLPTDQDNIESHLESDIPPSKRSDIIDSGKPNVTKYEPLYYSCNLCKKSFKLKRTLNLHITRLHIRMKKRVKQESLCANSNVKIEEANDNTDKKENHIGANGDTKDIDLLYKREEEIVSDNNIFDSENEENKTEIGEKCDQKTKMNLEEESLKEDKTEIKPKQTNKTENIPVKGHSSKKTRKKRKLKDPKTCEHCSVVFGNKEKYELHIRIKHSHEQPFRCDECDAKYFSKQSLQIHKRKHSNEKPYICSKCGKRFVSSNDLWQHNKIHDAIRQYPCDKCERSFKTHSNLRTHKHQMHIDPALWKFICTVCGKKFPLNTNLIKHMRRHEGIKPFCCNMCEKRFVEKVDLQVHLLSHSNERQFKCNLCEKAYKKRETLRRHWKIEHGIGSMKIKKPEKKLTCPRCPKLFAFNNKLQRHLLTHTGERPVACDFCEKRFRDNYDRNTHLKKEHNMQAPLILNA